MILNVVDSTGGISATPSFRVFDSTGKLKGMGTPVGSVAWGSITGTITAQTDLITYLSSNYVPLTRNITINGVTQDLSADRTWTISAGTGTVTSVQLTAGTGISLSGTNPITTSGNITVTNSAPDQTVVLTGGTGISVTGTYPSFTIASTVTGGVPFGTASGTDTYSVTISGPSSYTDGDAYLIRFTNGNTTGCTLNLNGLGAKDLYRNNDGLLIGGDIQPGSEMLCIYNSTLNGFQVIGTSPNSLIAYVTNDDSVTITKGQPVYAFSGTGDRMTVKRANNTSDATSAQTVGLVLSASIAANQKGFIMMQGLLDGLSILPTSTWSDGDPVYLGATAGAITPTKPYAPNHLVYLGFVTTASNGSAGRMYVRVQNGYELDELHNVQAQTPTYKDTLWYDNTVSPAQWKTASIGTILGYTPVATTRTISTTSPLTGGGDLSADRTLSIPAATSSVNGYLTSTDWTNFNTAYTNRITSLTTTGSSGAATLTSNVLNVPNYTLSGLGGVPTSRTLTINGTALDLSADRSWTVTAGSADLPEISVSTSNAREDDYAPAGWPNSSNVVKVIRINSTNTNYITSIGGLSSPTAGRIVTIYNSSTANNLIIIENLSTSSTAANRFRMTSNMPYFLLPNRSVTFLYDGTYWTQLSASNSGGFDFFDDFCGGGSTLSTTSTLGMCGLHSSGTGAGSGSGGLGLDVFGEIRATTGSTTTGFAAVSALIRRNGGNNAFGAYAATYSIPYITVSRIGMPALATVAQDFQLHFGMNGTSSLPTNNPGIGYLWHYSGTANPAWIARSQNTGGTTSSVTTSLTATTGYVWLGVYKPGGANFRDAVYFYSTDGVIYQVASKFVGVSGTYGGSPTAVIGAIAGTTIKDMNIDWLGSSFNLAR